MTHANDLPQIEEPPLEIRKRLSRDYTVDWSGFVLLRRRRSRHKGGTPTRWNKALVRDDYVTVRSCLLRREDIAAYLRNGVWPWVKRQPPEHYSVLMDLLCASSK